ncbi:MAG: hypothetical protein J6Y98_05125 [Bacteroidales bacterium]|nr:hypothetical protein [Bacteroidales bacterium]
MRLSHNIESAPDLWLERQRDALSRIELAPEHTPDVCDKVMDAIAKMPQPMALPPKQKNHWRIVGSAVAACLVAAVVVTISVSGSGVQAATPTQEDLSARFIEVYDYCNDYADEESIESAAYYDNPVSELF